MKTSFQIPVVQAFRLRAVRSVRAAQVVVTPRRLVRVAVRRLAVRAAQSVPLRRLVAIVVVPVVAKARRHQAVKVLLVSLVHLVSRLV